MGAVLFKYVWNSWLLRQLVNLGQSVQILPDEDDVSHIYLYFRTRQSRLWRCPNSTALIVGRAIAGVGGAGIASAAYTLIVCYILALQCGGQSKACNFSDVIGTLVSFALLMIAFCAIEWYQGERAIMVERLLSYRAISVGKFYILFLSGGYFLLVYYLLPGCQ